MPKTMIHGTFRGVAELTTGQAARELGCSQQQVIKLCGAGLLSVRLVPGGKHRRLRADEVRALAERGITPASASA